MFLGELRVNTARESLSPLLAFVQGIGQQLRLSELFVSDLCLSVEKSARSLIDHMPEVASELILRAETAEAELHLHLTERVLSDGSEQALTLTRNLSSAYATGDMSSAQLLRVNAVRELDAIQTVTDIMATSTDLDALLRTIIDKLVEAIDAERGTLYLVDEARGELYSKVLREDHIDEIRVKIGDGIAGYVAQTGEVVNIERAYDDPRFIQTFDRLTGFRTESILTAPIRNPKHKIIGVVQLLNKQGGPFTERDERLLNSMSSQAAISIENARLYAQEIQQQLVLQDLKTAKAIQESILPNHLPEYAGWDLGALWQPAQNVAGDFFDVQPLPDSRCAFLIADVSGKGIPAALFMALSVTVLRIAISLRFELNDLMKYTNRALVSFNPQSRMFASIFVGFLDMIGGTIQCVSAGHNPPLVYRAVTGLCEYVKIPGVIAGMFDGLEFAVKPIQLERGDILVLYTDGITEAMSPRDEEFGSERLDALVRENHHLTAQQLVSVLHREVTAHSGARGAFDDETLLVIKRL